MKNIVIGTAGHIDHGKTALIKALTGFEGDSLKEEQKRGITIELSFCNMRQNDINIAFIDVPGHEKLVKNMIAGAFGFDASLVVVDSKEGLMPQTKEHLEILNLLKVKNIVIALTKSDLVDSATLKAQEESVRAYIKELKNLNIFAILPTSIYKQESINQLKQTLFNLPKEQKSGSNLFRYYVDRSFSIKGAGVVVTGTVLDGEIALGEKIFISELQTQVMVKNLQVHEQNVQKAFISQRVAINLANIKKPIQKGMLLTKKGYIRGFNTIDVYFEAILNQEIRHNSIVNFHIGTKQIEAKVLLYENIDKANMGFAKIEFKEKVYAIFNEPFIITFKNRVVGGGRVINPINEPLKKRKKLPLLKALHNKDFKTAFEILIEAHKKGFGLISSAQRFNLTHQEALDIAKNIENIFIDEQNLVIYPKQTVNKLKEYIKEIYNKNQYAMLSAKSIEDKLSWASVNLAQVALNSLEKGGFLKKQNNIYTKNNIKDDNIEKIVEDKIYDILKQDGITPQAPYNIYDNLDIDKKLGDYTLKKLTKAKKVIRLSHNLFIDAKSLSNLMQNLREIIKKEGYIDLALFKQYYPMSRKYLVAYLDYLDNFQDIKKEGNKRVL
jgi:selenocysteine-specific elongation factor